MIGPLVNHFRGTPAKFSGDGNTNYAACILSAVTPLAFDRCLKGYTAEGSAGGVFTADGYGNGTSSNGGSYTVRSGDTLSNIASRNGISLAQLLLLNPQISNPNRISVGQTINLDGNGALGGSGGGYIVPTTRGNVGGGSGNNNVNSPSAGSGNVVENSNSLDQVLKLLQTKQGTPADYEGSKDLKDRFKDTLLSADGKLTGVAIMSLVIVGVVVVVSSRK